MTINTILKEMKSVPSNRLEELYQFIHSLSTDTKPTVSTRKKILAFGGAFDDMSDSDYADFGRHITKIRAGLFDRHKA